MSLPNQYGAATPYQMQPQQYPQMQQPQCASFPLQQQPPMAQGQFYYPQQPNYNYQPQFYQPPATNVPIIHQEPQYYPQNQQVIMQQPMMTQQPATVQIIQQGAVGAHPQVMTCPNCKELVTSKVKSSPTSSTHMMACLLCCCCCCAFPYCIDKCKKQTHSCPKCGTYLGEFDENADKACVGVGAFLTACLLCCDGDDEERKSTKSIDNEEICGTEATANETAQELNVGTEEIDKKEEGADNDGEKEEGAESKHEEEIEDPKIELNDEEKEESAIESAGDESEGAGGDEE